PDLLICDYQLGDMEGTEILEKLREKQMRIPVVMVTGHGNIRTAVDVMKMGAEDFLIKPFIPQEILGVINNTLDKYKDKEAFPFADNGSIEMEERKTVIPPVTRPDA